MYNKLYPTIIMYSNKLFNKILCKKAYLIITPLATSYLSLKKNTFIVLLLALGLYLPAFQFSFEDIYFSSSALLTYSHKPITKLSLSLSYYIPKRFMLRNAWHQSSHYQHVPLIRVRAHTTTAIRMKKNSGASSDLAADGKGIHPHVVGQTCSQQNCENKQCPHLCAPFKKLYTKGFFTHKPIAGKFCRFVSDVDSNNKEDTQYFVKNTDKTKEVNAQKATAYYQNNEIKADNKMNSFIQSADIKDKINE